MPSESPAKTPLYCCFSRTATAWNRLVGLALVAAFVSIDVLIGIGEVNNCFSESSRAAHVVRIKLCLDSSTT